MRTTRRVFEIFRQGEEGVCFASLARWNAQLKGLVEFMQEAKFVSERQEVLKGIVEDTIKL